MKTHDGASKPLGAVPARIGVGVVILVAGLGATISGLWPFGAPMILVGALVALDGTGGTHRVRVTPTKVVIEDDTVVRGFLIGPKKRRFAYADFQSAEIRDGALWLTGGGETAAVLEGLPVAELESVKGRIERAVESFAETGGT